MSQPVLVYDRIASNRVRTWALMAMFIAVTGVFVAVIALAMGAPLVVTPVVFAALLVYTLFSYFAASSVALNISGAHEMKREEETELHQMVENLCIGAGLPKPKIYVIEDGSPNAFATGRNPEHAAVVVTRGLLQKLDRLELEGVIAHELSHIGNRDTRVATIAVLLVGVTALLADFFLRWTWFGVGARRSNRGRNAGAATAIIFAIALIMAILAPLAAQAIRFAVSRQREYLADASGVLLTRYPPGLANALEKIAADPDPLEVANKATSALYINNPLREHSGFLNDLFTTHPPIAERIRILRAM